METFNINIKLSDEGDVGTGFNDKRGEGDLLRIGELSIKLWINWLGAGEDVTLRWKPLLLHNITSIFLIINCDS